MFLLMTLPAVPLGTRQLFSSAVMAFLRKLLVTICAATALEAVLAAPTIHATGPIVTLDGGTFIGTTADGVNQFLGIPFAQPPSVADVGLPPCPP
jgi:hypothetical protein